MHHERSIVQPENDPMPVWHDPHDEGLEPHQRLLVAMIRQALYDMDMVSNDYYKKDEVERQAKGAFWWLFINDDDGFGSLNWCCMALSLDRDAVRRQASKSEKAWRFACEYAKDPKFVPVEVLECTL